LAARARAAGWYAERLAPPVATPKESPGFESAWGIYTVLLPDSAARDRVQAALRAAGLPSAVYYPKPLHEQPAYRAAHASALAGEPPPPLPVSGDLCARVLSLPMHAYLTEAQVARVAEAVMSAF